MNQFINIGFGNIINTDKVVAILSPDSAPSKRLVARAKEMQTIIDATQGRRTKSLIITDSGQVVLSALTAETLYGRTKNAVEE